MKRSTGTEKNKSAEVEALRARLQEAEETIEAIRTGQVEALVVSTPEGPKIYTLEGADHRYRRLVETMNEGALMVSHLGLILYTNAAFATMVGSRLETISGREFSEFIAEASQPVWASLLSAAASRQVADEVTLRTSNGSPISTYLSVSANDDATAGLSVIVTNLTNQKRNEEIVASERLARSILEQAGEAIVVCDPQGLVIRSSRVARQLAGGRILKRSVATAFPLRPSEDSKDARHPALRALAGESHVSEERVLELHGREPLFVLCTAAALLNERQEVLGCVMSMTPITKQKRDAAERARLLEAERAARSSAEKARAEAEASNRSKDEFLATVSHELRTPLNAIVGWSRLMAEGSLGEEKRIHAVEVIRRNADAQARLIEDLLDVSRITSGQLRLDVRSVEPARFIKAAIESVRPALEAKEIRLKMVLDTEEASVWGDEARLQQIIWNLLANAAKFTPRKGRIGVALRRSESSIEIVVDDNGPGIADDFLPYIFDRFQQADGSIGRLHGGLGLGLAISRHLVELHGGTIEASNRVGASGAFFVVRLPRSALRESPVPEAPIEAAPRSVRLQTERPDLSNVHVVLVEDDTDSRDLLTSILLRYGAHVTGTDSGHDALSFLEEKPPHVLISDIGMAKMDGYALIRSVRNLTSNVSRTVPALALTAYARAEDRQRALAEGFQMHLAKPVDPTELAMAVASLAKYSVRAT